MSNDFVQFKCHSCTHCCTEVVCMPSPWDVRRIMHMTDADPFDFLEFLTAEELEDVDADDPTWLEVGDERYIMALKRDEKEGCHFLNKKTRLCSIYEARPFLCRLYPFKVEEDKDGNFLGFSLHEDVGCPKYQDGQVAVGPLHDMNVQDDLNQEDYHELVEMFNAKNYPGKEPEDFVILFCNGFANFDPKSAIV